MKVMLNPASFRKKKRKERVWNLPKYMKNYVWQEKLQNKCVTWSILSNALESANTIFLNKNGFDTQWKDNATLMFCAFSVENERGFRQQYYAIRQKNADGKCGACKFGKHLKIGSIEIKID